ncbi:MAG: GtrA family protein [Anaerolineales bacterium]|jgi:putative flippase GtrA|nr:GtrA family protein [Anaerolineales bacterium]
MILTDTKERSRFIRFALVGTLGAVIDFVIMNILSHWAGMSLVLAGTISFTCAVLSNFTWNRFWTYPESRSRPLMGQLGMFFIVNAAGVAIRIPILHFFEPPLLRFVEGAFHTTYLTAEFYARNLTLATAVGIVMMWNYFVNRYWTYNDIDDNS